MQSEGRTGSSHRSAMTFLAGLLAIWAVATSMTAARAPKEFTVIVLPDTQIYSQNYPDIFLAQTRWIVEVAEELNVRFVLHLGDVVNSGASHEYQYVNAKAALELLDEAGIPLIVAIGNHDYDDEARTRGTEMFNKYFGLARYEGKDWFGGAFEENRAENVYALFDIDGEKYLVLALEFGPRRAVIDWAHDVLAAYPDHRVIAITHAYMYFDDTTIGPGDSWNPKAYGVGSDAADGEQLWEELFSRHPNVVLVHSGHILGSGVGRRIDVGQGGNLVHQVLANYQMRSMGGEGYLRILRFRPDQQVIEVSTYSPYLDRYLEDEHNRFTLHLGQRAQALAHVSGRIFDETTGEPVAGARATVYSIDGQLFGGLGGDGAGRFRVTLPAGSYTVRLEGDGYRARTVEFDATRAGKHNLELPLVPLPYAHVQAQDIAHDGGWLGWQSGQLTFVAAAGPEGRLERVRVELRRLVDAVVVATWELYEGKGSPGALLVDTSTLDDGSYEVLVEAVDVDGMRAAAELRFGVRNWQILADELLPPQEAGWFGTVRRMLTSGQSSGWVHRTGAAGDFSGDGDRLACTAPCDDWLVWETPRLVSYAVTLYTRAVAPIVEAVFLEGSVDGETWTPLAYEVERGDLSAAGWRRIELKGEVPPGAEAAYFRLRVQGDGLGDDVLQLGRIELRMRYGE